MKISKKILTLSLLTLVLSALVVVVVKAATSLTPPTGAFSNGSPIATMYTLEDIYERLVQGISATEGSHSLQPSSAPAGTMHTLKDIYSAITPPTSWQTDPNLNLCWSAGSYETSNSCSSTNGLLDLDPPGCTGAPLVGAKEYCEYLDPDGSTLNCTCNSSNVTTCTPVDYWHLPFETEIAGALSTTYLPVSGGNTPGG